VEAVLRLIVPDNTPVANRRARDGEDPLGELVRSAQAGDRRALSELLGKLGPRLLRVVRGVLGAGHPELEDVLQDATVLVVRALSAFRGQGEVEGYAVRITLRAAITARGKYRARQAVTEPDSESPTSEVSPSDDALARRRREILRELLDEIPEAQAEALVLRTILGMSLAEAAAMAGVPENTVRSRMRLARDALRRRIESDPVLLETLEVET
jgi:RNA polymerase sigma-70 factor, ECF subfamily